MEQVGVKRLTGLLQEMVSCWKGLFMRCRVVGKSTSGSWRSFLRLTVNIE